MTMQACILLLINIDDLSNALMRSLTSASFTFPNGNIEIEPLKIDTLDSDFPILVSKSEHSNSIIDFMVHI
jgi:hypothetical protein